MAWHVWILLFSRRNPFLCIRSVIYSLLLLLLPIDVLHTVAHPCPVCLFGFYFCVRIIFIRFDVHFTHHIKQTVDMHAEVSSEATEIVTMAVDKFLSQGKYEQASRVIKDTMDKKFGPSWHCCIGEGFGFEVSQSVARALALCPSIASYEHTVQ